jgi:GTP-binding protein
MFRPAEGSILTYLMAKPGLFDGMAFFTSATSLADLPASRAEVAFAGRSNAGKSSAINTLARRNRLAFVSKTPGRTQQINFFSLNNGRFLVDLPGYGFAKVPQAIQSTWESLISGYLQARSQLCGIVVLMDIRHPLTPLDIQLLDWFEPSGKPAHVMLTKADKLTRQQATERLREVARALKARYANVSVQLFSATARQGLEEAEECLTAWFDATESDSGQVE